MRFFVGVTDGEWFRFLNRERPSEVNFWWPSPKRFGAVEFGAPFLFKLHKPEHCIVGGGFFAGFSQLPLSVAWAVFGVENGAAMFEPFRESIMTYRKKNKLPFVSDPEIGCTALVEPFFFDESDWIPAPEDWSDSIVRGKTYSTEEPTGARLWEDVQMVRLGEVVDRVVDPAQVRERVLPGYQGRVFGKPYLQRARLGQGAFRIQTLANYERRCCVTGETTLPVLEAAHIRPVARDGDHRLTNGLLLRADLHILYDRGLIGVDPGYRIRISPLIRDQYLNGKAYYRHDGEPLRSLPKDLGLRPDREALAWHLDEVFRA